MIPTDNLPMATSIFAFYAAAHMAIACWMLVLSFKRAAPAMLLIVMLALGYSYDKFIVAIGSQIGAGELLLHLNWPRFLMQALLMQLVVFIAVKICCAASIPWFNNRWAEVLAWIFFLGAGIYGIQNTLVDLELQPACYAETIRYTRALGPEQLCFPGQESLRILGPPVHTLLAAVTVIVLGVVVMTCTGWPWMFVGVVLLPIFAIFFMITEHGFLISGIGELLMVASLGASIRHFTNPVALTGPVLPPSRSPRPSL